jgi:CHAD domain-containing protein
MAAEGVEQELKYRVANEAAAARLAGARALGPFRAAGRARVVQVEDRYLDTANGALGRAGWAVRLRHGPTATVLSVKSTTPPAGPLHQREELEGPADLSLDPRAWPPSPARTLVLAHAGKAALLEIVTLRQQRRTRTLADATAEVELSIDEVAVVAGGEVVDRFVELEAELRRGPATALDVLAAAFASDPDLAPEGASKLERAMAAAAAARSGERVKVRRASASPAVASPAGAASPAASPAVAEVAATPSEGSAAGNPPAETPGPPRLVVGKTPGVAPDDVLAEAGRKVLRFHFARMLAKEAGTRSGEEIEDLHGMRVATRRMRAAWRVFGDGFRPRRTKRLRDRLRIVAGRLGAVRDLDVLLEAAVAYQSDLPPAEAAAFEPLVATWRDEREVARIVLLRELDSPAYVRLVEDYRVFVVAEGEAALAPASPVSPHRVRDTAGSRIWLAYEQVRAYESVLRWADIETVHQLRIASKWLRYTLEFFREALGPEVDQLIPRVVALQDHLGWLHDADVTIAITRQFLVANAGTLTREETHVIGTYLAGRERELARLRRTMGVPWRGVSGIAFRRLLGRAVSGL